MDTIYSSQITRNFQSRNSWESYSSHREKVTSLLINSAKGIGETVCVLGAGNCNDVDLLELGKVFTPIHLVDIDDEAVVQGITRQTKAKQDDIVVHGKFDVTGTNTLIQELGNSNHQKDIEELISTIENVDIPLPAAPFQVVASVCLLSQIVEPLISGLGQNHPRLLDAISALRRRHIKLVLDLTQSGGTSILISDFVSSVTCPGILDVDEKNLLPVVEEALENRNFFTGLNPLVLENIFEEDSRISSLATQVTIANLWKWNFGSRTYAVCAIVASRR